MKDEELTPASIRADAEAKATRKLTDWANEPTLKELKEDFQAAEGDVTEQVNKVTDWLDALNCEGKYQAPEVSGRSKVAIRLIRKQIEWRCPSLTEPFLSSPKLFEVAPRTFEDMTAAEQNELILNYQFKNKMNSVKLMDDVVRTAATEGTAILRAFWSFKEDITMTKEDIYEPVVSVNPAMDQEIMQAAEMAQQSPDFLETLDESMRLSIEHFLETQEIVEFALQETKEVEQRKVVRNFPSAEVAPLEDVFPDPTCRGDITRAKFLVYRFDTCLADLKEDDRYKNLDILETEVELREATRSSNRRDASDFQFKDTPRKSLEAYEYWGYYDIDGDGSLHSFVATWVGKTLIRMERNPYPDNAIPFTFIPLIPVKNSLYGEPDAELLKENQQIMSATMRGTIDTFARSSNGQVGTAKGFLDAANEKRFNQGNNYRFNNTMDPRTAVHMHTFGDIPQSVFQLMNYLTNEAESFSGVKSFGQGISGDSLGKTASSGRNALDATAKRDASILRRIAQGMVELAYKFQTMNSAFLTEDDVVRLTNKKFVRVDPENLSGDFDLSIDISTAEADRLKVETLSMILQTGQSVFPLEFTKMILAQIAKLERQPELEEFVKNFSPEPDPHQQQLQQLELARAQAEIEEIQARTQEMLAKAQVNAAEVSVRQARTENMQSVTDRNSIDTLKNATGVSQEEKLQIEDAKARNKASDDFRKHNLGMSAAENNHDLSLLQQGAKQELDERTLSKKGNSLQ